MEKHKFISRVLIMLAFIATTVTSTAQENETRRRHFSPEEFQAKQIEYITSKAELTQAEADAFFPLFFELQKRTFELERNVRKEVSSIGAHEMNEEQCNKFVNSMADVKIEIAKLEKEYTAKYLNVLTACKLMRVQFAETSFQRDLMKNMMRPRGINERMERKGMKK